MNKSKVKVYVVSGDLHESWRTIIYGQLTKSVYAKDKLWFVSVQGRPNWGSNQYDPLIHQEWTYMVEEKYATATFFESIGSDHLKWRNIARAVLQGGFDYLHECSWEDAPVYEKALDDKVTLRYGFSRTQSKEYPDHELWYVAMLEGHAAIVDKACVSPQFIEKMWNGKFVPGFSSRRAQGKWWRWVGISWCHVMNDGIGRDGDWRKVNRTEWVLDAPTGKNPPDIDYLFEKDEMLARRDAQLINRLGRLFSKK